MRNRGISPRGVPWSGGEQVSEMSANMQRTAESGGTVRPMPELEHQAVWSALVHDSTSVVMVIMLDGTVEYANPTACAFLGLPESEVVGRSYGTLFEENHAAERLSMISQVARSGTPMAIDAVVRGVTTRTVCRPIPANTATRLLLTSRVGPSVHPHAKHPESVPVMRSRADDYGRLATLTARELEILRHIGLGLSTADIAKRLHRSVKTVEWHRVSLGNKLGVTNRVELARLAISAGLVDLHSQADTAGEIDPE